MRLCESGDEPVGSKVSVRQSIKECIQGAYCIKIKKVQNVFAE